MSKSKKERTDVGGATAVSEPAEQVYEEAPRSDVMVTPNGDAIYVPGFSTQKESESARSDQTTAPAPAQSRKEPAPAPAPEKPKESKAARFKRLATRRLPRAVKAVEALIPLAGKAQYESSDSQREFLLAQLGEAVLKVKSAFSNTVSRQETFAFPD